jgi:hypothetical protein
MTPGNFRPQFVASILVGVFQMSSLERRLAAVTNRAANLNHQLRELYKLRDRVSRPGNRAAQAIEKVGI